MARTRLPASGQSSATFSEMKQIDLGLIKERMGTVGPEEGIFMLFSIFSEGITKYAIKIPRDTRRPYNKID